VTDERRRSPLAGYAERLAQVELRSEGRLRIVEEPFTTQLAVRAVAGVVSAAGATLPATPNTLVRTGEAVALWLGPPAIPSTLDGEGWAAVDVSAHRTTLLVAGPAVLDVLAHGCAVDLLRQPPQWSVQTMLARAPVVLYGEAPAQVRILVRASFAPYLAEWLLDAASEVMDGLDLLLP
jgi:sarcosine oxidase subunit gamma